MEMQLLIEGRGHPMGLGGQGRAKEEYVCWQWVGGFPGSMLLLAPWGPPSGWAILGLSKKGWDGKSSW